MRLRVAFILLLISSLSISCYIFFNKKNEKTGLLILPYDYYKEKEGVLLDLNDFKYLLDSDACEKNSSIIHIVTSFAGNVEARSAIRRAYTTSELESLGISRVFLLAVLPPNQEIHQRSLINENERYHDLVQGSFLESYRNLTYKHVMGIKWAVDNCKKSKYIIKSDDDILIDMYRLVDFIETNKFEMMGYVLNHMRPIRIKANKWYVTKEEYPDDSYPSFLSGWMYTMDIETAKKLMNHTKYFKYFWIDDLFVTGLIAQKANVTMLNIRDMFTLHPEVVECCLRKGIDCGFFVAPNGGDDALQIKFQIHSKTCYRNSCPKMPNGLKIEDKCVAKRKLPPLRKGLSKITVII